MTNVQRKYDTYKVLTILQRNVQHLMTTHMVTADELAAGCDTSVSTIRNVLNRRQFLTARNIANIATYFNSPIAELFKEQPDEVAESEKN